MLSGEPKGVESPLSAESDTVRCEGGVGKLGALDDGEGTALLCGLEAALP